MSAFDDSIENMRRLGPDWDSYGGVPIDERAIAAALRVRDRLTVGPTSVGGVSVELHLGDVFVEIEFDPDGRASEALVNFDRR